MKKIIVFYLIILFFAKTPNVFGYSGVFTVDNIEVTGKLSSQNYRKESLEVAFRRGFEKLLANIIRKDEQKELISTDFKTINSLISSYRILEEKILKDNYYIKFGIKFNRTLVEKFLQNKSISYSSTKKLEIIIYPILIVDSEFQVFSKNKFFEEWNNEKDLENTNFIMPIENLDDIDFIKNNISTLEENNLSSLVDDYEIKNSAVLIFRHDKKRLGVFLKTHLSGAARVKKIDFELEDINNIDARRNIILKLKHYIHELWKEENLIDISVPSYLTVNIDSEDKTSLIKIIERIKNTSLIDTYVVERMDNQSAKIKIKFFGKIKNLKDRLEDNGIEFKILHNEWNLYLRG